MFHKILHAFPIQLLRNHLKRNRIILLIWIILFGTVTGHLGGDLGLNYLILDPEYLHQSGFWSFFITGLAVGSFTMAFHITAYIIDIHRFLFVGALSRPFTKFCINNSFIPLAFLITYSTAIIRFQWIDQQNTPAAVATKIAGLLVGFSVILCLIFVYTVMTDGDIAKYLGKSTLRQIQQAIFYRVRMISKLLAIQDAKFKVESYLKTPFRIGYTKDVDRYYNPSIVLQILGQSQFNLILFELITTVLFFTLGFFSHHSFSQIPAAASGILLLTVLLIFIGLLSFWTRGWTTTVVIVLVIVMNTLVKYGLILGGRDSQAFGLNYETDKAMYSLAQMRKMNSSECHLKDKQTTLEILHNWRQKFPAQKAPKLVMVCASGGGQRAALWTMKVLQAADSLTGGKLMEHTMLMSCVSGGALGASYYRELCLRKKLGEPVDPYSEEYLDRIARNSLNPVIFNLVTNDTLLDVNKFQYQGMSYRRDRGCAIEDQINVHTDFVMEKSLEAYREPEYKSQTPMLLLTPMLNDGRQLFISSQNVAYMGTSFATAGHVGTNNKIKGIDFMRFFQDQGASQLRFLSALRMGASYPYVLPSVALPSSPTLYAMDAALADNFGIADAIHFVCVFKDWIKEHTSGIVLVIIRNSEKERDIVPRASESLFQKLTNPFINFQQAWTKMQDIRNDSLIELASACFGHDLVEIEFPYKRQRQARSSRFKEASLSWHLTVEEKQDIIEAIQADNNQQALHKLKALLQ